MEAREVTLAAVTRSARRPAGTALPAPTSAAPSAPTSTPQQPTVTADASGPSETTLVVESLLDDARAAGRTDERYQQLLKGDDASDGVQRRDGLVYSRDGRLYVPE